MKDFSVCLCVYHKDNAADFKTAVDSVTTGQTIQPSEVIIVADGPVFGDLDKYLTTLEENKKFKIIRLPKNLGHAGARQVSIEASSHDLVAIMDADDISDPNRFEKQLKFFDNNPHIGVTGGQINEFIDHPANIIGSRIVPLSDREIKSYLKKRCPFNQMTVMFKKDQISSVGGYIDWFCNEDYYLWIRLAEKGCKFANLPDTLVNVRVGKEMYARRGGWKYFKSEKGLQDYMRKKKMIGKVQYLFNVAVRFGVQVVIPNSVRGFVFKTLFRKNK